MTTRKTTAKEEPRGFTVQKGAVTVRLDCGGVLERIENTILFWNDGDYYPGEDPDAKLTVAQLKAIVAALCDD